MLTYVGRMRHRGTDEKPNTVSITEADSDMPAEKITEKEYRQAGIKPPFETLDWAEDLASSGK